VCRVGFCNATDQCYSEPAGGPIDTLSCISYVMPMCADGGGIDFCYDGDNPSSCNFAYYGVGSTKFTCASCSAADLANCKAQATMACQPAGTTTDGGVDEAGGD